MYNYSSKSSTTLVDQENAEQRYLILGSASRELIKQSSESKEYL